MQIPIAFMGFLNQRSHHWGGPTLMSFFLATKSWNLGGLIESSQAPRICDPIHHAETQPFTLHLDWLIDIWIHMIGWVSATDVGDQWWSNDCFSKPCSIDHSELPTRILRKTFKDWVILSGELSAHQDREPPMFTISGGRILAVPKIKPCNFWSLHMIVSPFESSTHFF